MKIYITRKIPDALILIAVIFAFIFLIAGAASAEAQSRINGTFLVLNSPWKHINLTQQEWDTELGYMQDIGIENIIIQFASRYYDTDGDGAEDQLRAAYPSTIAAKEENTNQIKYILTAADKRGFKVYIGLVQKSIWWDNNASDIWQWNWPWEWMNRKVAEELFNLYDTSHPSFIGFYIAHEPTINYSGSPTSNQSVQVLNQISTRLKQNHPSKRVASAPTFVIQNSACNEFSNIDTLTKTPSEFRTLLDGLLANTSFDIIFLQDKMGKGLVNISVLPQYFDEAKKASQSNNVQFGIDVETFAYKNCSAFGPAKIQRIKSQINAAAPYSTDLFSYSWFADMSPGPEGTAKTKELYQDYKEEILGIDTNPPTYPSSPESPVACTQEARMCPDGSAVGRTGPNCNFASCPSFVQPPLPAPTPTPILSEPHVFSSNLWAGMRNQDIAKLQTFLAKDPAIYPERIATGYYGTLTQKAVRRFQCKHNIVCSGDEESTGYGLVGPKTREKLNEVYGGQSEIEQLQERIRQLQEMVNNLIKQLSNFIKLNE